MFSNSFYFKTLAKAVVVVQRRCIPFEIKANDEVKASEDGLEVFYRLREIAQSNSMTDMSLEEIDEEIRLARTERKR